MEKLVLTSSQKSTLNWLVASLLAIIPSFLYFTFLFADIMSYFVQYKVDLFNAALVMPLIASISFGYIVAFLAGIYLEIKGLWIGSILGIVVYMSLFVNFFLTIALCSISLLFIIPLMFDSAVCFKHSSWRLPVFICRIVWLMSIISLPACMVIARGFSNLWFWKLLIALLILSLVISTITLIYASVCVLELQKEK